MFLSKLELPHPVILLLAARVPSQQWIRFVLGGVLLAALIGVAGIAAVIWLHAA
jgi:hypothetical protein